ncbi:hypothetical protein [Paracoccus sp. (in: a-proteobacteria)]|uniref:hypothetical protein n=1 Tax=Paracoccus sp. TaxID=267 RepID=UPI003A862054
MDNLNWLLRITKWARNPPGPRRVRLVLGVVLLALVIFGLERLGWWPDWAQIENDRTLRLPR